MALSSILFASALSLLAPLYAENRRIQESADGLQLAGSLLDEMRGLAEGSSFVYAATAADGAWELHVGRGFYRVTDGILLLSGVPVFSAQYYEDKRVEMVCENMGANLVKATLTVKTGARTLCAVPGLVGSLRSVLDFGNGLVWSDPSPGQSLGEAYADLGLKANRVDSTAPLTYIGGNDKGKPTNVAKTRDWLLEEGLPFDTLNIRSWAITNSGTIYWWTDQNISAYQAGEWVRVVRYNKNTGTYTPGYVRLVLFTKNLAELGSYIVVDDAAAGWQQKGYAKGDSGAGENYDYDKGDYRDVLAFFNQMEPPMSHTRPSK